EKGGWVECAAPIPPYGSVSLTPGKVEANTAATQTPWFNWRRDGECIMIETFYYEAKVCPDGSFLSFRDRAGGRELVSKDGRLNAIRAFEDYPGMYDAWDILDNWQRNPVEVEIEQPLHLVCEGPLLAEMEVSYRIGASRGIQRLRFFRDSPVVECDHQVEWQERNRLVKAMFDIDTRTRLVACDSGAGTIMRETHRNTSWQKARFEVCHHRWLAIGDRDCGLALFNDSKYGVSLEENHVGLSLLRGPVRPDPDADRGEHHFVYGFSCFSGNAEDAGIPQLGWAFNIAPRLLPGFAGDQLHQLFSVHGGDSLHLLACKPAEDDPAEVVLRWVEIGGRRSKAVLTWHRPVKHLEEVDILERPLDPALPRAVCRHDTTQTVLEYSPWQIFSVKVRWRD
ncbi:MAG: hypothetical protein D6820_07755, partial [Lentisphaerae bacterium]